MSEKKFVKLKEILPDKIVSVEVGTGMYNRVQTLLFDHLNSVEGDVSVKALNEIRSREPKNKFEYNLLTLLTLVYNIESRFQEQGFTKEVEVEVPAKES